MRTFFLTLLAGCCLLAFLTTPTLDVTGTVVSFSRRLDTCDTQDLAITDDNINLVYAFDANGVAPSSDNSLNQHTDRGTVSTNLLTPAIPSNPPSDAVTLDLTVTSVTVPFTADSPTTTYWCKLMNLGATSKRHIVSWEPKISPPGSVAYVHHIVLFVCPTGVDYTADVGHEGKCDEMTETKYQNCLQQVTAEWAIGGGKFTLPEDIGLPMGPGYPQFVMMQTHYNNPEQKVFTDSSGLRLVHTGQLRPTDAGIFWSGLPVDAQILIPAQTKAYTLTSDCPPNATKIILPQTGIQVRAVSNHMHLIGAAASLRHYRNGVELAPILDNPIYDFNFQYFQMLGNPRTILPGDNFATRCTWDSSSRTGPTKQGESTTDEMCMSFFLYSPRIADDGCHGADYRGISGTHKAYGIAATTNLPGRAWTQLPVPLLTQPYVAPTCTYQSPAQLKSSGAAVVKSIVPTIQATNKFVPSSYARSIQLNEANGGSPYMMYWNVNYTSNTIDIALSVDNSQGWIGMGISPTGGMIGSDIITAFATYTNCVASNPPATQPAVCPIGKQYLAPHGVDRTAKQQSLPSQDTNQDFFNIVVYSDLPLMIPPDSSSSGASSTAASSSSISSTGASSSTGTSSTSTSSTGASSSTGTSSSTSTSSSGASSSSTSTSSSSSGASSSSSSSTGTSSSSSSGVLCGDAVCASNVTTMPSSMLITLVAIVSLLILRQL